MNGPTGRPAPGVYRYWIEIKILAGLYTSFEGPREVSDPAGRQLRRRSDLRAGASDRPLHGRVHQYTGLMVVVLWRRRHRGDPESHAHLRAAGIVQVSLTATNGNGESDVATKTGYISVDELAAMGRPYPNPIHDGMLSIRLDWSRSDPPRIDVFDPAGRRIRVLTGPSSVSVSPILEWDLKDERRASRALGPLSPPLAGSRFVADSDRAVTGSLPRTLRLAHPLPAPNTLRAGSRGRSTSEA